jgi:regulator of sigma E protease
MLNEILLNNMSILIFIISLAILILVHEFGHFIVAKKSGIKVSEFALGFPPKIWGKKVGETEYTINAIPFGGFVKIYGEDSHGEDGGKISEEDKHRSMHFKPKWIQAAVLVAGVTMNIIFAWFLISVGYMIGLPSPAEHSGRGTVKDPHVTIVDIVPGSPAQVAGLNAGDRIVSVSNGVDVIKEAEITAESVTQVISKSTQDKVSIEYKRGSSASQTISVAPKYDSNLDRKVIGVSMDEIGTLQLPIHYALIEGAKTTSLLVKETFVGLFQFFYKIITWKADLSQVSGPVGIAGAVGQAQSLGFVYLLSIVALISINLAVINLLPFPALDGGRLLFVFIEAIIRRPLPSVFVRYANVIGFAFLLVLMLVVTGHDIMRFF